MTSTKRLLTWLLTATAVLALLLCMPTRALAEETITMRDMEQIRDALMADGDVTITLDGDVDLALTARLSDLVVGSSEIGG